CFLYCVSCFFLLVPTYSLTYFSPKRYIHTSKRKEKEAKTRASTLHFFCRDKHLFLDWFIVNFSDFIHDLFHIFAIHLNCIDFIPFRQCSNESFHNFI